MTDHSCSRSLTDSKMPTNGRHLYGESHYLGVGVGFAYNTRIPKRGAFGFAAHRWLAFILAVGMRWSLASRATEISRCPVVNRLRSGLRRRKSYKRLAAKRRAPRFSPPDCKSGPAKRGRPSNPYKEAVKTAGRRRLPRALRGNPRNPPRQSPPSRSWLRPLPAHGSFRRSRHQNRHRPSYRDHRRASRARAH